MGEDAKGVEFVGKVSKLFDEKCTSCDQRRPMLTLAVQSYISEHILLKPTMATCNKHYGRLVARFLHSFLDERPYD